MTVENENEGTWFGVQIVMQCGNLQSATRIVDKIERLLTDEGIAAATIGPGEVEFEDGEDS